MKEERHQHRFPQLITLLCKAIDIKQTKPEQANTVDINQSIKSPSDSCSQCQICCLSFSVLSLNVQPCWARAYSSLCLYVMCVLCFMCICVFARIHLSVCVCMSVCFPPCHPPDPQCKCASADKEPAGIQRSANTVCTTLNTEHTLHKHCTIVQYSTEHKDNPKTTSAADCGCCKHKMHCRDLAHCTVCIGALAKQHLHTAHWIIKEHIAHIMCSTAFYRHIS